METELSIAYYEAMVSRPGKFEGEPRWVPYFYGQMLDGCSSECGEDWDSFDIEAEEYKLFPELQGHKVVLLTYCDSGFVYGTLDPEEFPENAIDLGGEG